MSKLKINFFFLILGTLILFSFIFVLPLKAQEYSCSPERLKLLFDDPNSLRPYPGDPCYKELTGSYMCGNDIIINDQIIGYAPPGFFGCQKNEGDPSTTRDDSYTCSFNQPRSFSVKVDTSEADLPIAGNTENKDLSDVEKVNEYLSWYLNGVINNAEVWPLSDQKEEDRSKIIDFSGPVRKLLPLRIQNDARAEQVEKSQGSGKERHDQIVYCTYGFESILPDWTQFPGPCDVGPVGNALTFLTGTKKRISLSDWSKAGKSPAPQEENYPNFSEYYKAYREWRGDTCLSVRVPKTIPLTNIPIPIIGGTQFYFCFDNPTQKNFWGDLYASIPLTSTEDRKGQLTVSSPQASLSEVKVLNPQFNNVTPAVLYFPYLEQSMDLAEMLQTTYKAKDLEGEQGPYVASVTKPSCKVLQIRTNEGDSLKGTTAGGDFSYTAQFDCTFSATATNSACTKKATFLSKVNVQSPLVTEIWEKLVTGSDSVVRRMFPKLGVSSLGQLIDYPTSTKVTYSGSGAQVSPNTAEAYIPHIGGVSEYFLKGIQTMLRPKGFGDEIAFGPSNQEMTSCKGNAFAQLGPPSETTAKAKTYFDSYIKSRLTDEVVSAYAQAEAETGVPCEVLAGVHFMEGGNDPNKSLQNGGPLSGTLIESAIQAGHEIKAKVGGNLDSWESLFMAVARYNGEGNNNCGVEGYSGPCPPPWDIDNPYALSWIDAAHENMLLIYCWDFTQCRDCPICYTQPQSQSCKDCPIRYRPFERPGALTVATEFYNSKK